MISVKIISTPEALARLRARGPAIIEAITMKMNELMLRLQQRVVGESIPAFFKAAPNIVHVDALDKFQRRGVAAFEIYAVHLAATDIQSAAVAIPL